MSGDFIDPIVVRETRDRLSNALKDMQVGTSAADALLWFANRTKAGAKPSQMFGLSVTVHNTTGTEGAAENLLQAAAQHFHQAILDKAVGIAQAQLKAAEKSRKEGAR